MNWYCKVFLDSHLPYELVLDGISGLTRGEERAAVGGAEILDTQLRQNEDYDERKRGGTEDGFLYSRYYLDIEPSAGVAEQEYVDAIRWLLIEARAAGMRAVAACDFEDLIPAGYSDGKMW